MKNYILGALLLLSISGAYFYGCFSTEKRMKAEARASIVYVQDPELVEMARFNRERAEAAEVRAEKAEAAMLAQAVADGKLLAIERNKPPKIIEVTTVQVMECDSIRNQSVYLLTQVREKSAAIESYKETVAVQEMAIDDLDAKLESAGIVFNDLRDSISVSKAETLAMAKKANTEEKRKKRWRNIALIEGAYIVIRESIKFILPI